MESNAKFLPFLFWHSWWKCYVYGRSQTRNSFWKLSYFIQTNRKAGSVCFEFSYEEAIKTENVEYSISILEPTTLEDVYNFYPQETIGEFYRRKLPKVKIAVFQSTKNWKQW